MKKLTFRQEREILTAKLDYRNACAFVARAMRLGMDNTLQRARGQRDHAEKALLRLTLPYAHLSSEFSFECQALHGMDGIEAIHEIENAIARRDVEYMRGFMYALEYSEPIQKLMK